MFVAGDATQLFLIPLLEPDLADVIRSAVVGRRAFFPEQLNVAVTDAADVADDVRGDLAVGIVAEQARVDIHAGKTVAVHREAGHFLVIQPGADRNAGEIVPLFQKFLKPFPVLGSDLDQRRELVDEGGEVIHLRRHDLQRIRREVVGQHHSVAVQYQAPVGHHRDYENPVLLGQRVVVIILDDLNVEKPHEQ